MRVLVTEQRLGRTGEPTLRDLSEALTAWELPVIGVVPAASAILIRPDGYVAWVGEQAEPRLTDALTTWFGPPAPA